MGLIKILNEIVTRRGNPIEENVLQYERQRLKRRKRSNS